MQADISAGVRPRVAKKKGKDRQRAAQHLMETAKERSKDWKQFESKHLGRLKSDYYQGTKEKWDKKDIQPEEGPKARDFTLKRHRAGQRESAKKAMQEVQARERPREG